MGYRSDSDESRMSRSSKKSSRKKKRRRSYSSSSSSERSSRRRHKSRRSRSSSRSSHGEQKSSRYRKRSPSRKSHHKKSSSVTKKNADAVFGIKTGTLKDMFDVVPGFSKMTPAEQSKIRVRRALEMAEDSKKPDLTEEQLLDKIIDKSKDADIKGQISRAKQINVIQDDDEEEDAEAEFKPTHFRSKANVQKLSKKQEHHQAYSKREDQHELAMFGHSSVKIDAQQVSSMLSRDEGMKKKEKEDEEALIKAKHHIDFMERDPATLMSDLFKMTKEDKQTRWLLKLARIRERLVQSGHIS